MGSPNLDQGATIVCDLQNSPRGLQVVAVHSVDNSTAEPGGGGGGRPDRPRREFGDRGGDRFGGGGGDRFGGGVATGSAAADAAIAAATASEAVAATGSAAAAIVSAAARTVSAAAAGFSGGGGFRDRDSGPSGPMQDGKVKFFNDQKGFGFVMPDGGGGDIYMHASALRRSGIQALEPEQRIRFSTRQGNKGVEVDRVEVI